MSNILKGITVNEATETDYDDPSWDEKVSSVGQKAKQAQALKAKGKEPKTRWNPETKKYYVDFSDDDKVDESAGLPSPGTYEETNDMFKSSGQRRIGTLTTENDDPFRGTGGRFNRGDDERHDLDPTDWYIVKDGKLFAASIYPRQVQQAIAQGFSRTKAEARARASSQGVAEAEEQGIDNKYRRAAKEMINVYNTNADVKDKVDASTDPLEAMIYATGVIRNPERLAGTTHFNKLMSELESIFYYGREQDVVEGEWDEWEKDYKDRMDKEQSTWSSVFGGQHEKTAPKFDRYPRYDDTTGPMFGDGKKKEQGVAEAVTYPQKHSSWSVQSPKKNEFNTAYKLHQGEEAKAHAERIGGKLVKVDQHGHAIRASEGVAEGSMPYPHGKPEAGDKITWYHSNHYPEIEGTVVGWKDGSLIVQSVDPSSRNTEKTVAKYRVPKNNILSVKKQGVAEGWSQKYKSSINCSHPKGFSQKAHCAGKKKHNESIEMEMVCEDCGMCETHINHENLDEACWKGYHKEGNKKMFGKTYPNCVKNKKSNEDIEEDNSRVARKAGQPANSKKHSDLYTDENPKGTITGLKFATAEDARASVSTIRNSGRSHAHKIQAAVAMEQRAKAAGKSEAASVYRKYINATKKTDEGIDLEEACWDTHKQVGMKNKGGKQVPNCVPKEGVAEEKCPHCGGEMVSEELINEKKDACYYKVKSRYKVWPSAYASGALVKCRNKGASNWGNGGKKNESSILEGIEQADESLHDWFNKEKWVRMDTKGKIKGPCAREPGEGKPKCLPQSKAHSLGKKGRASAAARKRREDPNPDRSGKAINVNTKKKD